MPPEVDPTKVKQRLKGDVGAWNRRTGSEQFVNNNVLIILAKPSSWVDACIRLVEHAPSTTQVLGAPNLRYPYETILSAIISKTAESGLVP